MFIKRKEKSMSFYSISAVIRQEDNENFLKRELYIYNTKEELSQKITSYLASKRGCYEMIWLGVEMKLMLYEDFCLMAIYDLHPYIVYSFEQYPILTFDSNNLPVGVDINGVAIDKDDEEFDRFFSINILDDSELDINVDINLNGVLDLARGRPLEIYDIFSLDEFGDLKLHYGHNDLENDCSFSRSGSTYMSSNEDILHKNLSGSESSSDYSFDMNLDED